ncbi:ABC transporter permease [Thermus thermamylovorans]|uniref:ABC transporter permease n=1 Tax=Thermus thermamylovorans TaxID=2509362 RepID=A0A4Q9AWK2_9DEIN|nr:ABC transporter permease [Thermus thermamylovorans]TBH15243.1 ABC transporter permease [Thermus thermamylovorans]
MEPPLPEAQGLRKGFGALEAVGGVSLALRPGEVRALLGPDRAGKTTTAKMVAGLLVQGLMVLLIALALTALTGARLAFTPLVLLPTLAVLLGTYGLGSAVGSLVLLYKQMGQLLGFSQFLLLFLLQAPGNGAFLLLPLAPVAALARGMLAEAVPLDPLALLLAFLNGLLYLALGLFLFARAVCRAKRQGLLHGC